MSTRSLTMVINRKHASESDLGFAQNPVNLDDKSYVNMYLHHDGYLEWRGVQLANWIKANNNICGDSSKLAAKLVHDMYYDSCYLYPNPDEIDHQYTYVVWTGDKDDIWISCYDQYNSTCILVNRPDQVVEKYSHERFEEGYTTYTDWDKLNTNKDG